MVRHISDKKDLKDAIDSLNNVEGKSILDVIELANDKNICIIDDKLRAYKVRFPYIYDRVMEVPYNEFVKLFDYVEGYTPFSTQHKTKGAEFNNVLVILDNGNWNQYNFEALFTENSNVKESVLNRTRKIFYVCCTRTKENLAVFYHNPSEAVLNRAKEWFGEDNVIEI